MSAPALNTAAPPAAGPSAGPGAAVGASAAQAKSPLAAFEAMLETLFGAQATTGVAGPAAATPVKTTGKSATGGKAANDSGKAGAKTGAANADGAAKDASATTTTPDATLALVVATPPIAAAATTVTTGDAPAAGGSASQAPVAVTPDKTAGQPGGQTASAALAQLAGAQVAASDASKVADAATAAGKAQAATTNLLPAAKTDASAAPAAPTPAPSAAPATNVQVQAPVATAATLAQATPPQIVVDPKAAADKAAEAVAATSAKDAAKETAAKTAAQAPKTTRVEATRTDARLNLVVAKTADAPVAMADGAGKGQTGEREPQTAAIDAKTAAADNSQAPADQNTASTTTPATLIHAAAVAVRGSPQTVANLSAQIAKKLDGRSSRFDVQLDPAGLGKVDVHIEIGAGGRMSAAMSFDTPQAAAELRARAGELQKALEQAGFDLSGGLSFDVASERGQGGGAQEQNNGSGAASRGRAFQAVLETTDTVPNTQLYLRQNTPTGVDIRI